MANQTKLSQYAIAGYPAVAIATSDEDRAIGSIISTMQDVARQRGEKRKLNITKIASTGGLQQFDSAKGSWTPLDKAAGYTAGFSRLAMPENENVGVLIVLDFQHVIRTPIQYRNLREALNPTKDNGCIIVMLSPSWSMPPELEHDIPVINDSLPSRDELASALDVCIRSTGGKAIDEAVRTAILDSASGLTLAEAEGAIALSHGANGFDPDKVLDEKLKLIRQSGYLEVTMPEPVSNMGGLGNYRQYIEQEVLPAMGNMKLQVRGIGLVGVSGGGKSLGAKVLASMLGWPLLRCDIQGLMTAKVGASQEAMASALKLAEAVAPCVLFFDEIN